MDSAIAVATPFTQDADDVGVVLLDAQGTLLIMDDCASRLLGLSESVAALVPSPALFSLKRLTFEKHLTHARLKGNWHFQSASANGDTLKVTLDYRAQQSTFLVKIRHAERIHLAEQDYRLAFDSAGTGLALLRMSGEWIAANQMLCQMLGYTEAELRATSFQRLTHPDDTDISKDELHRLILGHRTSLTLEKRYIRKDGSTLWARLTLGIARNADAEALYFVSQLEDISEHLALRQALFNNEQKYLSLAKSSQNIILRYNRLGQQIYANPELERARGFPNTHITERASTHNPLDEYFRTQVELTLSTGVANTFLLENRGSHSRRSVDFLCNLTPEHDETGELCGVLVTAQDISALRRQERAENARSAIFQKMVTHDTLREVLPLLGAYLDILTPGLHNAMALDRKSVV